MATIIPRQPTGLEALSQALGLAIPGMVQGAQQRTLEQEFGIPAGLSPQLSQTMALQQLQRSLAPAPRPIALGPGAGLFDPKTGEQIAGMPTAPQQQPGFTIGRRRYDAAGNLIVEAPGEPTLLTEPERRRKELIKAGIEPTAVVPKARAGQLQIAKADDPSGFAEGTVFQADAQGNIRIISEAGGEGLTAVDRTKLAVTQAKEFRADPRIKDLQIIERSEKGMQAALRQSTSPNLKSRIASDQALGVLFQKMLDPTSVVRESEYARTPEGASAVNRLRAIIPQLRFGGLRLDDEDRFALVNMAQKLLNEAKISANKAFDEFDVRADELKLNKRVIFGGAKRFDIPTEVQRPSQGQQQPLTEQEEVRRQELLRKAGL